MCPTSQTALNRLRHIARGHPGASSGERAAWELLANIREGQPVDFAGNFIRLDATGQRAVIQILVDVATGKTTFSDLH
jgi:hypothetical protein